LAAARLLAAAVMAAVPTVVVVAVVLSVGAPEMPALLAFSLLT